MKKVSQIVSEDKTLFGLVPVKHPSKRIKRTNPDDPRNYSIEKVAAQESLFETVVNYGIQRKTGVNPDLTQIAHALILCGLPYRKTDAFEYSRCSRAADGSQVRVTFYSCGRDVQGNRIPLAFGVDRTVLHWAVDEAIKNKSSFVQLDSTSKFIRDIGQADSGQNYTLLARRRPKQNHHADHRAFAFAGQPHARFNIHHRSSRHPLWRVFLQRVQ
jgi:hypothetical protein